ncbi:MAG: FAD-binding protein, partial [Omnitrophica WOR_2 bacterium]
PGMRLHQVLVNAIEREGGRVYDGMQVESARLYGNHIDSISSAAAARLKNHRAKEYILATGGILGGGFLAEYSGEIREAVFNLPIQSPGTRLEWFERQFLSPLGHPVFHSGIRANPELQPVDEDGKVIFENLRLAGSALDGFEAIRERSLEGVALVTGYTAGRR